MLLKSLALSLFLAGMAVLPAVGYAKPSSFRPISATAQAARMGAGVNILGYDPYWQDGQSGNYTDDTFAKIKSAGFSTVRLNLFIFGKDANHLGADGTIDPKWLKKLDWVVAEAEKHGLDIILDEHDFEDCSEMTPDDCAAKLNTVWRQLGERYKDAPNSVIFELLNEPHDNLNGDAWNKVLAGLVPVVRAANPTRNLIIGPTHWNSIDDLDKLQLPADNHIIVTFHYYKPMTFTHQGATWAHEENLHDIHFGTPAELKTIKDDFDAVAAWGKAHHRPIFLGEFGAYDKAPMADRVKYDSAVARAAEAHGFPWAYWQFSSDFVLYDFSKQQFVAPILKALRP
jgi:endoglucanase